MPRPTAPVLEPSRDPALAAKFAALFAPGGITNTLVTDQQQFTEGPSYLPKLDAYVFSDIPRAHQMIHRRKDGTGASILVPASNNTNGTFYSAHLSATAGNDVMLCCEHGGRAVVRMEVAEEGGKAVVVDRRTIVNTYGARMLNSPNDVIETKDGWVVFTDPMYGCYSTHQGHGKEPEQPGAYAYKFHHSDPTQTLRPVVKDMVQPNGLTIPPTGDRIYIADTGVHQPWLPGPEFAPNETTRPRHIRVYPISSDCTVDQANGKLFASIKVGAADGIRTDVHGNVWACCGDGIHVFSPEGELLGKIRTPFSAVNMVWGSPNYNEILLCAHNQVWKIAGVKEGLKRVDGNGKL